MLGSSKKRNKSLRRVMASLPDTVEQSEASMTRSTTAYASAQDCPVMAVCSDQDLIKVIFRRLDLRALCASASVCRLWNQVGNSEDFWREISFNDRNMNETQVRAVLSRHRCVQKLDISGVRSILDHSALFSELTTYLQQLRELRFAIPHYTGWRCREYVLGAMFLRLPSLEVLHLEGVDLSSSDGSTLQHPRLHTLRLEGCESFNLSISCERLQTLSLAYSLMQRLPDVSGCPALVSLDLRGCRKLQDSSIRAALPDLTQLQTLHLSRGVSVTDDTLREMAIVLTSLSQLMLSGIPAITLANVRGFPALRHLDLSSCDSLAVSSVQATLESLAVLEVLVMDSCLSLTNLKLNMPRLREISLRGCNSLIDLDLNCWRLSALHLGTSSPGSTTSASLQRLSVASGALSKMELVHCRKLSVVELSCPQLTDLLVRECDNIQPAVFESLGDRGPPATAAAGLLMPPTPASGSRGTQGVQHTSSSTGQQRALRSSIRNLSDMDDVVVVDSAVEEPGILEDFNRFTAAAWQLEDDHAAIAAEAAAWAVMDSEGDISPRFPSLERTLEEDRLHIDDDFDGDDGDDDNDRPAGGLVSAAAAATARRAAGSSARRTQATTAMGHASASSPSSGPSANVGSFLRSRAVLSQPSRGAAAPAAAHTDNIDSLYRGLGAASSSAAAAASPMSGSARQRAAASGNSPNARLEDTTGGGSSAAAAAAEQGGSSRWRGNSAGHPSGISRSRNNPLWLPNWFGNSRNAAAAEAPAGPGAAHDVADMDDGADDIAAAGSSPGRSHPPAAAAAEGAARTVFSGSSSSWLLQQGSRPRQQEGMGNLLSSITATVRAGRARRSTHMTLPAAARAGSSAAAAAAAAPAAGDIPFVVSLIGEQGAAASDSAAGSGSGGGGPPGRPPSRSSSGGKGGVPRLRCLRVECCESLPRLSVRHSGLETLAVSGCPSLNSLVVAAPRLGALKIHDAGDLQVISLQQVCLPNLSLGGCSSLSSLELSSSVAHKLDLQGCGHLQQLVLDCPALSELDTTFCSEFGDAGLTAAVASAPPLQKLVLSVCCQIGSQGLMSLSCLSTLQHLDLSYTEVSNLTPIFSSCPQLRSLSLSSCRSLQQNALMPLLSIDNPALPLLSSLDASYCDLDEAIIAQLLGKCSRLEHLALNGCSMVTDRLWQQLEQGQLGMLQQQQQARTCMDEPAVSASVLELDDQGDPMQVVDCNSRQLSSKLESLSLVRCSNLKSLCLGLLPASGQVDVLESKHYLLSGDREALHARAASYSWVEVPSAVSELTSLRVGLSGVQVVALSLPKLAHLDLSSCGYLRVLELRCPLLLTLHLQACRSLPVFGMAQAVMCCQRLEKLDVQHMLPAHFSRRSAAASRVQHASAVGCFGGRGGGGAGGGAVGPATVVESEVATSDSSAAQLHQLLDEVTDGHPTLQQVLRCPVGCGVCARAAA